MNTKVRDYLWIIYNELNDYFGYLNWWPGEDPFEIVVGAILTQNTNWRNVEVAIGRVKDKGFLSPRKLFEAAHEEVAELIRPSGYYNVKTVRLKAFLYFLHEQYDGSLDRMFESDLWLLRDRLLGINGIGEETADSILLYAGRKPIFVVDAYTRRILERHNLISDTWTYGEIQQLFMENLPGNVSLFNQYHALVVTAGKSFCKKKPLCKKCPLNMSEDRLIRLKRASIDVKQRFPI